RFTSFLFTTLPPPEIYTLSLHDALPISSPPSRPGCRRGEPNGHAESDIRGAARRGAARAVRAVEPRARGAVSRARERRVPQSHAEPHPPGRGIREPLQPVSLA